MSNVEKLIDLICAERQRVTGTPPNLTRARLSLKVGVDLTDRRELDRGANLESKIRDAAQALGITLA